MATPIAGDGIDVEDDVQGTRVLNWATYQRRSAQRLAMYHGMWLNQLQSYVQKRVSEKTWQVVKDRYAWNRVEAVLAAVVKRCGTLYARAAYRALLPVLPPVAGDAEVTDPVPDAAYAAAIRGTNLDVAMGQALHYVMSCGLCLIRVAVHEGRELYYQVVSPPDFVPITAWENASRLVGVRHTIAWAQDPTKPSTRTMLWDMEGLAIARELKVLPDGWLSVEVRAKMAAQYAGWIEIDQSGKVVGSEVGPDYPYRDADGRPVLPYAMMRTPPPPNFLCNPAEGRDLQDVTLQNGRLSVEMYWLMSIQSHRQLVIKGFGADKVPDQAMTPHAPLVFPTAEDKDIMVDVLDFQSTPENHLKVMDHNLETVLLVRGWSAGNFKKTAAIQSADALLIEDEGKQEFRAGHEIMCRETEGQLASATVVVWNADRDSSRPAMPDRHEFLVNFADPTRINILSNTETATWLLDMGIESVSSLMLAAQPDLGSRENAQRQALLNRDENRRLRARGVGSATAQSAAQQPAPNPAPQTQET